MTVYDVSSSFNKLPCGTYIFYELTVCQGYELVEGVVSSDCTGLQIQINELLESNLVH